MNITGPVAVQSCFGLIELEKNGKWNPSLTSTTVDVVCERDIELKRQEDEEEKVEGT